MVVIEVLPFGFAPIPRFDTSGLIRRLLDERVTLLCRSFDSNAGDFDFSVALVGLAEIEGEEETALEASAGGFDGASSSPSNSAL